MKTGSDKETSVGRKHFCRATNIIQDYLQILLVSDLNNPKTFRDFTKPIGALNEARLKQLQVRTDALYYKDDSI